MQVVGLRIRRHQRDRAPVRAGRRIRHRRMVRQHNRRHAWLLARYGDRHGEPGRILERRRKQHDIRREQAGVVDCPLRARDARQHFVAVALETTRELRVRARLPLRQENAQRAAGIRSIPKGAECRSPTRGGRWFGWRNTDSGHRLLPAVDVPQRRCGSALSAEALAVITGPAIVYAVRMSPSVTPITRQSLRAVEKRDSGSIRVVSNKKTSQSITIARLLEPDWW